MKKPRINFKKFLKHLVLAGLFVSAGLAHAGSYEDFFRAIKRDDANLVQLLISRGFDPNTPNTFGQLGFITALEEPSPKVVQVFVRSPKIKPNALNAKGESPLMIAAIKGDIAVADQLIKKGADVNKTGWTPLHYAASGGNADIIKLLLEKNAYIDAESPNGTTPLMMASMYGSTAAVKLLLTDGADASLKNQLGATALNFAQDGSRPDAISLLTQVSGNKNAQPGQARSSASPQAGRTVPQPTVKPKTNGQW